MGGLATGPESAGADRVKRVPLMAAKGIRVQGSALGMPLASLRVRREASKREARKGGSSTVPRVLKGRTRP